MQTKLNALIHLNIWWRIQNEHEREMYYWILFHKRYFLLNILFIRFFFIQDAPKSGNYSNVIRLFKEIIFFIQFISMLSSSTTMQRCSTSEKKSKYSVVTNRPLIVMRIQHIEIDSQRIYLLEHFRRTIDELMSWNFCLYCDGVSIYLIWS